MILAHMSDFHIRPDYISKCNNKIKQIKKCINENDVELIVYTGDVIDFKYINTLPKNEKEKAIKSCYNEALPIFKELFVNTSLRQIIICSGNHDIIRQEKEGACLCDSIDEDDETYINAYRYFDDFCESLIGSKGQYKTRIEKYISINDNKTYNFLITNTNWFRQHDNSKSTSECINCLTVKKIITENFSDTEKNKNIFISHLPIDLICEFGKYSYGSKSGNLSEVASEKFSIFLAGDKHTVSSSSGSYLVGNPLYEDSTTIGIHCFLDNTHTYKSINIYNDKFVTIADKEKTKEIFDLCKPFLSSHATELIFSNKNFSFSDSIEFFSYTNNSKIKSIEEMYQQIINFKNVDKSQKIKSKEFSFNFIAKLIEQYDKETCDKSKGNIINFKGEHESGKSTFLSILFLYLLNQHIYNSYKYIPIYFNIEYYRNKGFDGKQILKEFKAFLKETLKISQEINKPPCYIIDGLNQYCFFGDNPDLGFGFDEQLKIILNNYKNSVVLLSIDTFDHPIDVNKSIFDTETGRWKSSKYLIFFNTIQTIPQYERKMQTILRCISDLKGIELNSNSIIKKIYDESILSMHLMFLYEYFKDFSEIDSNVLHNLNSNRLNNIAPSNARKLIATDIAINIFFNKNTYSKMKKLSKANQNNKDIILFKYIKSHKFFSNYLIAKFYVTEIKKIYENKIKPDQFGILPINKIVNAVLPQPILYFIRQEFEDRSGKIAILDCLEHHQKDFDEIGIANLVYLLGRSDSDKGTKILNDIKIKISKNKRNQSLKTFKKEILYRSITISQILTSNEKDAPILISEYIRELINDPKKREINRVFHRMYYQDTVYLMEINKAYNDIGNSDKFDFYYTYNTLRIRLKNIVEQKKSYRLMEIDLFTLCDLISCRLKHNVTVNNGTTYFYQENNEESITTLLNDTIELIEGYLNYFSTNIDNSLFLAFLKSVLKDFKTFPKFLKQRKNQLYFHPSLIINQLDTLKNKERQGWLIRGKHANRSLTPNQFEKQKLFNSVESIAEHIYTTYLIGLFYLPSYIENDNKYNKQTILNIILLHDIGESYTGDCSPYMNTFDSIKLKEDEFNRRLFSSWIYIDNTDFSEQMDLWDLWKEKSNNGNINYQIASELDKVQLLYQLSKIEDKEKRFTEQRIKSFNDTYNQIKTPLVKNILRLIVDENIGETIDDFFNSLNE